MSAGKAKLFPSIKVEKAIEKIQKNYTLKSDDPHILGLAKAANVKTLSSADRDLHKDFKTIIGGDIYQTENHKGLLKADLCPEKICQKL